MSEKELYKQIINEVAAIVKEKIENGFEECEYCITENDYSDLQELLDKDDDELTVDDFESAAFIVASALNVELPIDCAEEDDCDCYYAEGVEHNAEDYDLEWLKAEAVNIYIDAQFAEDDDRIILNRDRLVDFVEDFNNACDYRAICFCEE